MHTMQRPNFLSGNYKNQHGPLAHSTTSEPLSLFYRWIFFTFALAIGKLYLMAEG